MLDKETRKQLEEAWLCEMALTKKQADDLGKRYTLALIDHIARCFLFKDVQWYSHWLKECGNYLVKLDDIRLKPHAKRPTKEFFLKDDYICGEWETASDIKSVLDGAIFHCSEVDREDATNDEALVFLGLWNSLRYKLADYLSDEDTFDRSDYIELIDKVIKEYNI